MKIIVDASAVEKTEIILITATVNEWQLATNTLTRWFFAFDIQMHGHISVTRTRPCKRFDMALQNGERFAKIDRVVQLCGDDEKVRHSDSVEWHRMYKNCVLPFSRGLLCRAPEMFVCRVRKMIRRMV